jgi:beta-galactosidase
MSVLPGRRSWADPTHVATNRLPMRVPLVAHPTAAGARRDGPSPWQQPLDGAWRFTLLDRPDDLSAAHVTGDASGWPTITVPGHWTTQGWDRPHYTNIQMPFPGLPPTVPDDNPTGVYRTTFAVPPSWSGRRVVLHVGAAESVLYVFVNGAFAASSTDSRLAAEVDVTDLVTEGANELCCVVVRWSAASHVEDQDHWWMAGLHRGVHVEARGPVHLGQVRVDAGWTGEQATLAVRAEVRVVPAPVDGEPVRGWTVRAVLETLTGDVLHEATAEVAAATSPYLFRGFTASVAADVPGVRPWSAEEPRRYRLVLTLLDAAGAEVESVVQVVGFRAVEVRDGLLRVNGVPITVQGVNRHDHHPDKGKAVDVDDIRADLVLMKQHNVNAVRASHYPNDPALLDLCDELGLYLVDEANLECHAWNELLAYDPAYRETWLERVARMVERDANHACVIAWSLGNESGYGPNHDAAAAWVRRVDPSRPLHYEPAVFTKGWDHGHHATDLVCPMYPELDAIVRWAEGGHHDRPLVMCEYSHAMGNSNGGLMDYWAAIDAHEQLQGGFLWEWKDHGLRQHLPDGQERFAYGGQFGDEPNDANFVADGLVSPELEPHPAMREVLWVHRPAAVRAGDEPGTLVVRNRRSFSTLDDLTCDWVRLVDGAGREHGTFDVAGLAPGAQAVLALPSGLERVEGEQALVVRWRLQEATSWAPAGHLVGWDEVALPPSSLSSGPGSSGPGTSSSGFGSSSSTEVPTRVRSVGDDVVLEVGPLVGIVRDGRLVSVAVEGREVLAEPMRLWLFRAPVDNDGLKLLPHQELTPMGRWLAAGLHRAKRRLVTVDVDAEGVACEHEWSCDGGVVRHVQRLTVHHDGLVIDDEVLVPEALADLPRIGNGFVLTAGHTDVEWFAVGPHETYPDRCASGVAHRWCGEPDELPYLVPQEFGARVGVRWLQLRNDEGRGVEVRSLGAPLVASVTHHTVDDLFVARDRTELVRRDEVVVHLDVAQRGLGTRSCGPDTAERFRIPAGSHRWRWALRPVVPA